MPKKRRIIFPLFDQFLQLDMAGPSTVFSLANEGKANSLYECAFLTSKGGIVASYGGPPVESQSLSSVRCGENDTIICVGGERVPILRAMADKKQIDWLKRNAARVARVASVCTGSFLLSAANVLDGKTATTHWEGCADLQASTPMCNVAGDQLYVQDGNVWTSAGVSTGIDMALEMLRQDHGNGLAGRVAKQMVVYAHRPGYQSQFSNMLDVQVKAREPFAHLLSWMHDNLDRGLKVGDLADYMSMSERTFYRKFTSQTGQSPAKFLDHCKLEKAASLLALGMSVKETTARTGFKSEAGLRAAFVARFGISPTLHKKLHAQKSSPTDVVKNR